jgi:hypothetical protein
MSVTPLSQSSLTTPPYLDQYKAYIADLGNFGTRYTTANGFYISVITALLGILALTKAGDVFAAPKAYLGLAVSGFAVLVCLVWSRSIASYRKLFGIKFTILREMEQEGHLFPIYRREDELREKVSLLQNERLIPILLGLPFLVTFMAAAWGIFK